MRIGVVISRTGDFPRSMLTPFRLGLGGKLGNGRQYMSWIHLEDVARAFVHALNTHSVNGPVNLSSPNPVTNAEFTKALARTLSRRRIQSRSGCASQCEMAQSPGSSASL